MKSSLYNYYVNDKDNVIIFNGLTEASLRIGERNADVFKAIIESPDKFVEDFKPFIDKMKGDGFIIDDEFDEEEIVRKKYDYIRHGEEYMVMILSTYQCNLRCWYCTQDHADSWMSDETVRRIKKRIEKELRKDAIKHLSISWFGGEPLLAYDRVVEISRWAKEFAEELGKGFGAVITTNGTLLNRKRVEELRDAGINYYQITIDGNRETHNNVKILGKDSAYDRTIENIGYIIEHTHCTLRFNYTKENLKPESLIKDLDEALSKENREKISFLIYKVWQEKAAEISQVEIDKLMELAFNIGITPKLAEGGMCYVDKKNFDCIFANGNVGKCDNESPEDRNGILTESGDIEWISDISAHRSILEYENCECKDCRFLPLCWGPCTAKRETMLKDNGKIVCQFDNKDFQMSRMIRNKHVNKEFSKKKIEKENC